MNEHDSEVEELLALLARTLHGDPAADQARDAYEFAIRPLKLVTRLLDAERRQVPGMAILAGAKGLPELQKAVHAGIRATWEIYGTDEPDWWFEAIVLDRNFDKLPALSSIRSVRDCAPRPLT